MKNRRPQIALVVLALVLGLVASAFPGIAQPSEAPPGPTLELVSGTTYEWLKSDLLLVSFELRNTGTESVVVAQRPGLLLSMSCRTEDGSCGLMPGGMACSTPAGLARGTFLELGPGEALLGEKVLRIPEDCECVGDITVTGVFEALSAKGWDLPTRETRIDSRPFLASRD
jgi:hypothetical protein